MNGADSDGLVCSRMEPRRSLKGFVDRARACALAWLPFSGRRKEMAPPITPPTFRPPNRRPRFCLEKLAQVGKQSSASYTAGR